MWMVRAGVMGIALLAVGLANSAASARVPALPWYERAATAQDLEELDRLACAPQGTHLEAAALGSNYQDPQDQLRDLAAEITCSPHDVADALIWRRLPWCSWTGNRWVCRQGRSAADFIMRGEWVRLDFHESSFSRKQLRKLAADLFQLGAAGTPRQLLAHGPCSLRRDRAEPVPDMEGNAEYVSMGCADKVFGIDEERRDDVFRYSIFWSDIRR
jgi:hypothetical protein